VCGGKCLAWDHLKFLEYRADGDLVGMAVARKSVRSSMFAGILSLIVTGLGRIYSGQVTKRVIVGEAQQRASWLRVISLPWTNETC
jgi:hypothetical protein